MSNLITASIVLYNNADVSKTIECILNSSIQVKLYLIDNSPTNALQKELKEYLDNPNIHYVFNNCNVGFGAAHNIAIKKIIDTSEYHLILNPDVVFDENVIEELVKYMNKNNDVGLVMPKVIYPDGSTQYLCKLLPTPVDLIFRRFLPKSVIQSRTEFFELRFTNYNTEMEVPYLSGCFMFLRTNAIKKVGLFDERFFMYPEDIDLTRRINKYFKTMFYPNVQIVHEHGKGSYKNFRLLKIHIINMIKYFNKWGWIFDAERKIVNKRILSQLKNKK